MEIIFFLVIIAIFAIYIFVKIKISDMKYRAKQTILKDTGLSSSDINAGISSSIEKKQLQKFLDEYPKFTEESIKDLLKYYTEQIIMQNPIEEFSEAVCNKIQRDSKLVKMQSMEFRRVNIGHYSNSKLNATIVYTDNRDEYNIVLCCTVNNNVQVEQYQISKSVAVGM